MDPCDFHASDLQAALAALINLQEAFQQMYRICIYILLLNRGGSATTSVKFWMHWFVAGEPDCYGRDLGECLPSRLACIPPSNSTHFCVIVCTQISSRKRSSKRGIKSEDATPLLRLLFRPSSCKRSLKQVGRYW